MLIFTSIVSKEDHLVCCFVITYIQVNLNFHCGTKLYIRKLIISHKVLPLRKGIVMSSHTYLFILMNLFSFIDI